MTGESAFALLVRSFFRRLFENDLVPDGVDVSDALAWLVPLFSAPAFLVTLWLLPKYALVADIAPEQFAAVSWPDKVFFIGYSMAVIGLLTALLGDAVFPDRRGVVKSAAVLGIAPVAVLTWPAFTWLWGVVPATQHTIVCALLGLTLIECLMFDARWVPFTRPYLPGSANIKLLWPVYLIAMTTYSYTFARLSAWLMKEPGRFGVGCIVLLAGVVLIDLAARSRIDVDDGPDSAVQVLDLARPS